MKNNKYASFGILQNLMGSSDGTNDHDNSVFRILKTKTKRHSTFIERFWVRHRQSLSLYSRLNPMHKDSQTTTAPNLSPEITLPSDIQLHCLDANTLLSIHNKNRYRPESIDDASSLANSSLDLEWEHEKHNATWLMLQEDFSSGSDDNGSTSEISRRTSNSKLNTKQMNQMNGQGSVSSSRQSSRQDILPHRGKYVRRPKSNNSWSHISTPDSLEWDVHEDERKFKSEEDLLDHETMELLHEIEWLKNRALEETGDQMQSQWENQEQQSWRWYQLECKYLTQT